MTTSETHSQVLERTGFFDIGESGLEVFQLNIDFLCGLIGFLDLQHTERQMTHSWRNRDD